MSNISQRFNDYLSGLQEVFKSNITSMKGSNARRFNLYLGHLRGEFEFMSLEIESLQKERDDYKAEVENPCRNLCERCGIDIASNAQNIVPSQETTPLFSSNKPSTSQQVDLTHETAQDTTIIQTPSLTITQTPQSVSDPRSSPPALTVEADSDAQVPNWTIIHNNEAENELDVELAHVLHHGRIIYRINFSQDGKSLVAGCLNGKAYIYDVETGHLSYELGNMLSEDSRIHGAVCFSRDGRYLATDTWGGNIYIWGVKKKYIRNAFQGHTHFCFSLRFSPNDRLLVSASYDNSVRLWNMRDGTAKFLTEDNPTFIDQPHYSFADFSPDGQNVAASHRDGVVRIWDLRTGWLMRRVISSGWVSNVKFMPDGKGLVTGCGTSRRDAPLMFWNISSLNADRLRTRSQTMKGFRGHISEVEAQTQPERVFSGHQDRITSLAVSCDGMWVASGSLDNSVRVWDTRHATMQCILDGVHEVIRSVDFSPAGCYLASGGDGFVRVWKYTYRTSGLHSGQ